MKKHHSEPTALSPAQQFMHMNGELAPLSHFAQQCGPKPDDPVRSTHRDPTADTAIGAVDRQLRRMRKEAEQIAILNRKGRFTLEMEIRARRRFIGIFRPLLEEALKG